MNNIEFAKLSDKRLSHEARSLYLFYLRPMAERGLCLIDLPALSLAMETISSVCPFIPTENLITDLLNELNLLGFIEKKRNQIPGKAAASCCLTLMPIPLYCRKSLLP